MARYFSLTELAHTSGLPKTLVQAVALHFGGRVGLQMAAPFIAKDGYHRNPAPTISVVEPPARFVARVGLVALMNWADAHCQATGGMTLLDLYQASPWYQSGVAVVELMRPQDAEEKEHRDSFLTAFTVDAVCVATVKYWYEKSTTTP